MNNDLISKEDIAREFEFAEKYVIVDDSRFDVNEIKKRIMRIPAVDAESVRHGRWIMRGGCIRCSECDAKTLWKDAGGTGGFSHEYEQVRANYCHNCGAKM